MSQRTLKLQARNESGNIVVVFANHSKVNVGHHGDSAARIGGFLTLYTKERELVTPLEWPRVKVVSTGEELTIIEALV